MKNALVFAASGAVAGAVATQFARSGLRVHCSARRGDAAQALAAHLVQDGAQATGAEVDALDEGAVRAHVDEVRARYGSVDVVFNGIGGRPESLRYPARVTETPVEDFLVPLQRITASQFLTAREAARVMVDQRAGTILFLSATLSGGAIAYMAGISAACGAVEAMMRAFAGEVSPLGIRVNCLRPSAMVETRTIQETGAARAALRGGPAQVTPPLFGRFVTLEETGKVAAFLASDAASGMTGQVVTVCAGQFFSH